VPGGRMDRPSSGQLVSDEVGRVAALEGVIRTVMVHPQWAIAGVAKARPHSTLFEGATAAGHDESVVEVPPGRTGRIGLLVRARFDSSIAVFDSGHRALSPRRRELGREDRGGFARRTPPRNARLKWMRRHSLQNQGKGVSPSLEKGRSGRMQVCGLVSCTVVPRSCARELTG
jgi:hypothetical protein